MKKNDHRVGVFSAVFVLLVIGAAWYALFGQSVLQSRIKEQTRSVQAQPPLLDITGLEDAYDAILNKSTKEFIGYHAIDEGFLSWFTGNYGVEALENIAAYATLDNPDVWHRITGSSIHVLWYRYCKETGIQEYALDRICEKECSSPYEIVLDFTGDFSLADGVGTTDFYRQNDSDMSRCIDAALLEEMRGADILVVNNEFVYSSDGEPLPKKDYHFRADPSTVEELAFLGVDAAGVANNHVFDYGEEGLLHTLETLEDAGMPYMGAGRDLEEASEPLYFIANGRKIAIVAATQIDHGFRGRSEDPRSAEIYAGDCEGEEKRRLCDLLCPLGHRVADMVRAGSADPCKGIRGCRSGRRDRRSYALSSGRRTDRRRAGLLQSGQFLFFAGSVDAG